MLGFQLSAEFIRKSRLLRFCLCNIDAAINLLLNGLSFTRRNNHRFMLRQVCNCVDKLVHVYDTIRDAILTCVRKPT